jgi:hypothetical protein
MSRTISALRKPVSLILLAVLALGLTALFIQPAPAAPPAAQAQGTQWEYRVITTTISFDMDAVSQELTQALNAEGQQGWELVSFQMPIVIFKRLLP